MNAGLDLFLYLPFLFYYVNLQLLNQTYFKDYNIFHRHWSQLDNKREISIQSYIAIPMFSALYFLMFTVQAEVDIIQNATDIPDSHHDRDDSSEDLPHTGRDGPLRENSKPVYGFLTQ